MMATELLPGIHALISKRVKEERRSHKQISVELKGLYPGVRGLSIRSVRRFCEKHDIHVMSLLTNEELDRVVSSSVAKVHIEVPALTASI